MFALCFVHIASESHDYLTLTNLSLPEKTEHAIFAAFSILCVFVHKHTNHRFASAAYRKRKHEISDHQYINKSINQLVFTPLSLCTHAHSLCGGLCPAEWNDALNECCAFAFTSLLQHANSAAEPQMAKRTDNQYTVAHANTYICIHHNIACHIQSPLKDNIDAPFCGRITVIEHHQLYTPLNPPTFHTTPYKCNIYPHTSKCQTIHVSII